MPPRIVKLYDDYKNDFAAKGCTMLDTTEDYETRIKSDKVKIFKIQYACGHILDKCYYHTFMSRGSNSTCRICTKQEVSTLDTFNVEAESIKYLVEIIGSEFDMVTCVESCKADIIIKPKDCKDDKWLPVQLKSTIKSVYNQYKFVIGCRYTDEVGIFICLNEKRQWIFEEIPDIPRINIGTTKYNKYVDYEVETSAVNNRLMKLWNSKTTYMHEDINVASSELADIEQEYVKIREDSIKCLTFEKPERNQMVYDFKVNGKKVQEKTVASKKSKDIYSFKLTKSNGIKNKVRKFIPYHIEDNDVYWLNLRHTTMFYVIPSGALHERGYLQKDDIIGKNYLCINPNSDEWYNEYKFNYNDVDVDRLVALFA